MSGKREGSTPAAPVVPRSRGKVPPNISDDGPCSTGPTTQSAGGGAGLHVGSVGHSQTAVGGPKKRKAPLAAHLPAGGAANSSASTRPRRENAGKRRHPSSPPEHTQNDEQEDEDEDLDAHSEQQRQDDAEWEQGNEYHEQQMQGSEDDSEEQSPRNESSRSRGGGRGKSGASRAGGVGGAAGEGGGGEAADPASSDDERAGVLEHPPEPSRSGAGSTYEFLNSKDGFKAIWKWVSPAQLQDMRERGEFSGNIANQYNQTLRTQESTFRDPATEEARMEEFRGVYDSRVLGLSPETGLVRPSDVRVILHVVDGEYVALLVNSERAAVLAAKLRSEAGVEGTRVRSQNVFWTVGDDDPAKNFASALRRGDRAAATEEAEGATSSGGDVAAATASGIPSNFARASSRNNLCLLSHPTPGLQVPVLAPPTQLEALTPPSRLLPLLVIIPSPPCLSLIILVPKILSSILQPPTLNVQPSSLNHNSQTTNHKPHTLNSKPSTLNPNANPKPNTPTPTPTLKLQPLIPRPYTLNPQPEILIPNTLNSQSSTLDAKS